MVTETYSAVMQREFQHTNNKVGKGFALLGIYLFVVCYCRLLDFAVVSCTNSFRLDATINSTTWLYGSEIMPMSIRSRIVGVSAFCHYSVNTASTFLGISGFPRHAHRFFQSQKLVPAPLPTSTKTTTMCSWRVALFTWFLYIFTSRMRRPHSMAVID
jgi:hypothetical protein